MKKIIFLLLVVFAASIVGCKPATPPADQQAAPPADQQAAPPADQQAAPPAAEQAPAEQAPAK